MTTGISRDHPPRKLQILVLACAFGRTQTNTSFYGIPHHYPSGEVLQQKRFHLAVAQVARGIVGWDWVCVCVCVCVCVNEFSDVLI